MSQEEQHHVISHENEHFSRRDYLVKPFCFLAALLHWFNPLVWLYFKLMTEDMERSCDDRVLRKMTSQERAGYAETLLQLGMKSSGIHLLTPMAFGESNTKTDSARAWLQEACRLAMRYGAASGGSSCSRPSDFAGKKRAPTGSCGRDNSSRR